MRLNFHCRRQRTIAYVICLAIGLALWAAWSQAAQEERAPQSIVAAKATWAKFRSAIGEGALDDRLGEALLVWSSQNDPRVAELLAKSLPANPPGWLVEGSYAGDQLASSLRLALAERLHFFERHADCLSWTEGLEPSQVYSPELLAYLRAVASRQGVDYAAARHELEALEALPENFSVSRRVVVEQLRRELAKENPEGLSHVTKLMQDAHRRLEHGAAAKPTQHQQQEAIDGITKLIDELEKQREQMRQAQAGGAGGGGSPAEESRPSEFKAPGEVNRKRFSSEADWGDLPPAEREKLTQEIARGFPAHYRELISEYFEALAEGEGSLDQIGPDEEGDR